MSIKNLYIATIRNEIGTRNSKRLEKIEKKIPAVIYIKNKKSISISINHNQFYCFFKNKQEYDKIINIKLQEEIYQVITMNIQHHQYKSTILHIDFKKIENN